MRNTATASSSEATSLSMPNSAMCTGGRVVVRSALPRPRRPVMAPTNAFCSLGSSKAWLTRRAKCARLSGTRLRGFSDRVLDGVRCRHRRQAYGPDTNDGAFVTRRVDDGVGMGGACGARELDVPGRHLDRVWQAVESARKNRGHQAVGPRQGGDRLEGATRPLAVGGGRVGEQGVELD